MNNIINKKQSQINELQEEIYNLNNRTCLKCIDYKKCFMNQIGIGSGNFGKECNYYKTMK